MIDQISSAASALSRSQGTTPAFLNAATPEAAAASTPDDFSGMISQMIANTAEALHQAETTSIAGIQGKVPLQQVVQTVLGAQQSLQAAIAVRDKITAAYLELSRMAI